MYGQIGPISKFKLEYLDKTFLFVYAKWNKFFPKMFYLQHVNLGFRTDSVLDTNRVQHFPPFFTGLLWLY